MNLRIRGNVQRVPHAVHPHACRARAPRQDIRRLRPRVARPVDMQANTERHAAVRIFQIRRAVSVPRKKALGIRNRTAVAVNGFSEIRLAVDGITKILQHRQLHLQERGVVAVLAMAHHARGLEMGNVNEILVLPSVHRKRRAPEELRAI